MLDIKDSPLRTQLWRLFVLHVEAVSQMGARLPSSHACTNTSIPGSCRIPQNGSVVGQEPPRFPFTHNRGAGEGLAGGGGKGREGKPVQ